MSALIAQGPPSRILESAIAGRIELVIPEHVLLELRRVLEVKLGFSSERAKEAIALVGGLAAELLPSPRAAPARSGDPDDDIILEASVQAGAEVLVSGDRRHLLPLGTVDQLRILTPQALLAELAAA